MATVKTKRPLHRKSKKEDKPKFVRTTISLPQELHEKMGKWTDAHPNINWSQVARDAFENLIYKNGRW